MAKPDSALSTTKRRHLQWEAMLVIVLAVSLIGGRVLSPMFLSGANLSNMLADFTEIALIALPPSRSATRRGERIAAHSVAPAAPGGV